MTTNIHVHIARAIWKMVNGWTAEEIKVVVGIRDQANIQTRLVGVIRNRSIFEWIVTLIGRVLMFGSCNVNLLNVHSMRTTQMQF